MHIISMQIFRKGKCLLLDVASPDAIVRLQYSKLASEFDTVFNMYFNEQSHSSLFELLNNKLPNTLDGPSKEESVVFSVPTRNKILLLQVTTHSDLLSEPDIVQLCNALKLQRTNIACFYLQQFDTEMDFCNKLKCVLCISVYTYSYIIIITVDTWLSNKN